MRLCIIIVSCIIHTLRGEMAHTPPYQVAPPVIAKNLYWNHMSPPNLPIIDPENELQCIFCECSHIGDTLENVTA